MKQTLAKDNQTDKIENNSILWYKNPNVIKNMILHGKIIISITLLILGRYLISKN